jgi:hypothetical protein
MAGRDRAGIKRQETMLADALKYIATNPRFKEQPSKTTVGYTDATKAMVLTLIKRFPDLSSARVAQALGGLKERYVRRLRVAQQPATFSSRPHDNDEDQHRRLNNIKSTNSELSALRKTFPKREYQDDPSAASEPKTVLYPTLVINNDIARYKVDQSYTAKRPITLPDKPFDIAA